MHVEMTEINSGNVGQSIKIRTTISGGPDSRTFLVIAKVSSMFHYEYKPQL